MGEQKGVHAIAQLGERCSEILSRCGGRKEWMKVRKGLLRLQNVAGIRTGG